VGFRLCLLIALLVSASVAPAQKDSAESDSATSHAVFSDVETWARSLDDVDRHRWQLPDAIVDSLRIRSGQKVADIGAGTGYFNALFADAVGPTGRVYAIDIQLELIEYMQIRAVEENTPQVECILATPNDPCLPDSLDLVFFCNTYRYIDGRRAYLTRIRDRLLTDGRIVVIDYRESERDESGWRLPSKRVEAEMEAAGFMTVERFSFLSKQYFLVFKKNDEP